MKRKMRECLCPCNADVWCLLFYRLCQKSIP